MLTTVVGNYPKIPNRPRPARLRNAINRFDRGEIGDEELRAVEDDVTRGVIDEQVEAGLNLISDGQIRWEDEQTYVARRLGGVSIDGLIRFFDSNTYFREPVVEGPLVWTGPITVADFRFAAGYSPRPVKAVLPGPYTLARLSRDEHYHSLEKCVMAYAEALNREALALQEAGAAFVQLNEPAILRRKSDLSLFQRAIERTLAGVTAERALYLYFGDVDGLYPQLLDLPIDVLGLDFVAGARNREVLRTAPFTKTLGLGLVDARNTRIESVEQIVEGLRQVQEIVSLDRVHLSPSCGLEFLPREVAQAKLARMVQGARRALEVLA
jgi:5-methyltetrahydropteroyltriglutamate--homocysteine methyltransferase